MIVREAYGSLSILASRTSRLNFHSLALATAKGWMRQFRPFIATGVHCTPVRFLVWRSLFLVLMLILSGWAESMAESFRYFQRQMVCLSPDNMGSLFSI